jgi:hypothetical protein
MHAVVRAPLKFEYESGDSMTRNWALYDPSATTSVNRDATSLLRFSVRLEPERLYDTAAPSMSPGIYTITHSGGSMSSTHTHER